MEIPEPVPNFIHYPHSRCFSHILQGESDCSLSMYLAWETRIADNSAQPRFSRSKPGLFIFVIVPWTFLLFVNHDLCNFTDHQKGTNDDCINIGTSGANTG